MIVFYEMIAPLNAIDFQLPEFCLRLSLESKWKFKKNSFT